MVRKNNISYAYKWENLRRYKHRKDWYRIVDESGEDYLYPPDKFEIV